VEDIVSIMFETKPGRFCRGVALLLLWAGAAACKSGTPAAGAPEPVALDAPDFSCKRMALGDPTPTEYECPDTLSAAICASRGVAQCRPTNRTRGTVPPGGACRRGTWDADAKDFELGDNCAPIPRFAFADTPKGSVCVKESSGGPYCTHNCQTAEDCADVVRAGSVADCRGGGCFLIRK
jgi:hypothetical protein